MLTEDTELARLQSQVSVGGGNETGKTTVTSQCFQKERDRPDDSHKCWQKTENWPDHSHKSVLEEGMRLTDYSHKSVYWLDYSHKSVLAEDRELARPQSQVSVGRRNETDRLQSQVSVDRRNETDQTTVTSQC